MQPGTTKYLEIHRAGQSQLGACFLTCLGTCATFGLGFTETHRMGLRWLSMSAVGNPSLGAYILWMPKSPS